MQFRKCCITVKEYYSRRALPGRGPQTVDRKAWGRSGTVLGQAPFVISWLMIAQQYPFWGVPLYLDRGVIELEADAYFNIEDVNTSNIGTTQSITSAKQCRSWLSYHSNKYSHKFVTSLAPAWPFPFSDYYGQRRTFTPGYPTLGRPGGAIPTMQRLGMSRACARGPTKTTARTSIYTSPRMTSEYADVF